MILVAMENLNLFVTGKALACQACGRINEVKVKVLVEGVFDSRSDANRIID